MDLIESVIDPKRSILSPHVFDNDINSYKLKSSVRSKILRVWSKINSVAPTGEVLIVGGIATFNYSDESDVDVTIQIISTDPNRLRQAKQMATSYNGKELAGPHEINYFVKSDIHLGHYDSVYSVIGNRWIKGPAEVSVDVDKYMNVFDEVVNKIDARKAALLRDLIDYGKLHKFSDNELDKAHGIAKKKLSDIESDIEALASQYDAINQARKETFLDSDPARVAEFGRINALPENVIYLLLRRYCYINFLYEINRIARDGLEVSEVPDVVDAYTSFNTCAVYEGLEDKLDAEFGDLLGDDPLSDIEDEFSEKNERRDWSESTAAYLNNNEAYFSDHIDDWNKTPKVLFKDHRGKVINITKSLLVTPMFNSVEYDRRLGGWHLSFGVGYNDDNAPLYYCVIIPKSGINKGMWTAAAVGNTDTDMLRGANDFSHLGESEEFDDLLGNVPVRNIEDEFKDPALAHAEVIIYGPMAKNRSWFDVDSLTAELGKLNVSLRTPLINIPRLHHATASDHGVDDLIPGYFEAVAILRCVLVGSEENVANLKEKVIQTDPKTYFRIYQVGVIND